MNVNINKNGSLNTQFLGEHNYLLNCPNDTHTEKDWSFGTHTMLSDGTIQLTGTAPSIQSSTFTVNANDIIVFEFTVSVPTPSTTTGGPGLYLGTKMGDRTDTYYWSNNAWVFSQSADPNPYFLIHYNSIDINKVRTYILGSNVDINLVPQPQSSSIIYALRVPNTTTYIRSGYNSNTSMVINLSNLRLYKLQDKRTIASVCDSAVYTANIIEY